MTSQQNIKIGKMNKKNEKQEKTHLPSNKAKHSPLPQNPKKKTLNFPMDKESVIEKTEKIIEKIHKLNYKFSTESLQQEMNEVLNEIVNLLESYSYAIEDDEDLEERPDDE